MKKFSFLSATVMMAVAVVLFVSCQKEQSVATTDNQSASTAGVEGAVVASTGTSSYAGSIPENYATALAANYIKKYGNDGSQSITFSAKDLVAFLQGLQSKYKSDIISVNFGVYGKGAAPVSNKDYGKLTVFFTGNKIPKSTSSGNNRGNGADDIPTNPDQYLNHGQIFP